MCFLACAELAERGRTEHDGASGEEATRRVEDLLHQRCVRLTLRCEALHHEALTWLLLLTGVSYDEWSSKWLARGSSYGQRYHVGRYETAKEAVAALRAAKERLRRVDEEGVLANHIDAMCKRFPDQLAAFQARFGALHTAQLLSDDELYALEDLIGDFCDLRESVAPQVLTLEVARSTPGDSFAVVGKLRKLAAAGETFTADAALARQLRRRLE